MAEVMTAQYIRTARLKGVSFPGVVIKHALRNALIAPFYCDYFADPVSADRRGYYGNPIQL